ncbi:hypothetical protein PGT21_014325 [Puccinia graminis f. sp. tritici]|uniref:Uncharacterized protein n=1 Tax=Puccinia graminis f. sp. tritici TaxID=56615 RepID=A0A5B0S5X7_PUCGR|nr:hypothetical protein PGT21_014325 [Puccinia graminis f. sp. tritici]KAA1132064.1 hypothetical protein PGTUg99_036664 [Puccinia graminis f. sp. tritici]
MTGSRQGDPVLTVKYVSNGQLTTTIISNMTTRRFIGGMQTVGQLVVQTRKESQRTDRTNRGDPTIMLPPRSQGEMRRGDRLVNHDDIHNHGLTGKLTPTA